MSSYLNLLGFGEALWLIEQEKEKAMFNLYDYSKYKIKYPLVYKYILAGSEPFPPRPPAALRRDKSETTQLELFTLGKGK